MENRRSFTVQKGETADKTEMYPPKDQKENVTDDSIDETWCSDATLAEESQQFQAFRPAESTKKSIHHFRHTKNLVILAVLVGLQILSHISRSNLAAKIQQMDGAYLDLRWKMQQLEAYIKRRTSEVDVADYLEGARIIYEHTTQPYSEKGWFGNIKNGWGGEMALNKAYEKGCCYSFNGNTGKLAIAFKNPKLLRKIGIFHPQQESNLSALKGFSLYGLINGEEEKIGDYQYEVPGDSYQQFLFEPVKCTGIILRVHTNHGHRKYTCIYKVYAFE